MDEVRLLCVLFCSKSNQSFNVFGVHENDHKRGVHAERNGGSLERADISDIHVYVAYNFIYIYTCILSL